MSNLVELKSRKDPALDALKDRFVRIPSPNGFPRFRDVVTQIDQGDCAILRDYYLSLSTNGTINYSTADLVEKLEWMYGDSFLPNGKTVLPGKLQNLWVPPQLQPSGKSVSSFEVALFIEFLERWFSDPVERKYFLWFLAHTVRRPEKRIIATPILRSEHGIGKGFFAESLMSTLLGKTSVAVCSIKEVTGDFNEILAGKTFVLIDEVYQPKTAQSLKSIQGNSTFPLRRKHQPTVAIDNYINFVITSNDKRPIAIEVGDRRLWIPTFIQHRESAAETASFINKQLKPWLESGGYQLVRDYLEGVDLNDWQPTAPAPSTSAKDEMIGGNEVTAVQTKVAAVISTLRVVTVAQVKRLVTVSVSDRVIQTSLTSLGCILKRTNVYRLYITPLGQAEGLTLFTKPATLASHLET